MHFTPVPRGAVLTAAVAALFGVVVGCGEGTQTGQKDGAVGQSGGSGAGGSVAGNGGTVAGNGGAVAGTGGRGGQAGQGGLVDAGGDAPVSQDGANDFQPDVRLVNPTITMLTPSSLPSNTAGSFTLLVDGRDFPPDAEVCLEANCWLATFVSETRISALIPGVALGGSPRQAPVEVSRTGSPPLRSNILYFTITAPQ